MCALFFLALAVLVIVVILPRVTAWGRGQMGGRPARRDELVKDPVCQTYVVMSRALRSEVGDDVVHFCSRECQERYRRGERRA
jgi:YHS domain-containing protein